jgi:hypothetical protein
MVRKKPPPAVQNIIEIPEELITHQKNVELCIDAFFVNELAFLATISKNIMYHTSHPVETRKQSDYRSTMNEVIKVHNQAGLHVSVVYADQEFEPLLSELKIKNLIDDYN